MYTRYITATGRPVSHFTDSELNGDPGTIQQLDDTYSVYFGCLSIDEKIKDGEVVPCEESEKVEEYTDFQIRAHRNQLISNCDWTVNIDSPLSDSKKEEWKTYRQALRDITNHENFPKLFLTDWPTPPE